MKYFTSLLFVVFFISSISIHAQSVRIDGMNLNTTVFDETDLFKGVLVSNQTREIQKVLVTGLLSDQNGRHLMEIEAKASVNVEGGFLEEIEIINTKDYTGVLLDYINTTGILPQALLTFCVKVSQDGNDQDQMCFTQSTFINHHLNLVYPYDLEEINTLRPSLFWSFTGHSSEVTYRITLKKKGNAKNNTEGFNFGQTILRLTQVPQTEIDFPAEIPDLEEGEIYLWEVEAFLQDLSLGKTDIWEFKIGEPFDISGLPISKSYIDIDEIIGEPLLYIAGTIKLKIVENEKAGSFAYQILEPSKKKKKDKVISKEELKVEMRENYYDIDLKEKYYLKHKKTYSLLIKRTGVKDPIRINFVYINPDYIK